MSDSGPMGNTPVGGDEELPAGVGDPNEYDAVGEGPDAEGSGEAPGSGEHVYDSVGEGADDGTITDGSVTEAKRAGLDEDEESLTDDDALAGEGDVTNLGVDHQHG